jgi:lipopolysaccharide transport system permease protein
MGRGVEYYARKGLFRDLVSHGRTILARKELLYSLARKEFKVKYKSAFLGFLWVVVNPLIQMVILSVLFIFIVKIKIRNYPAFILTGLVPWSFLAVAVMNSVDSVVENRNLIKKIYFPREILPLAVVLSSLATFFCSLAVLFVLLAFFHVSFSLHALLLPAVIFLQCLFIAGMALLLSGLNAFYRDVKYLTEAFFIVWFYGSPIFYSPDMVPARFRSLYFVNPMAGLITIYRDLLLNHRMPDLQLAGAVFVVGLVVFLLGFSVFQKYERVFADVL